MNKHSNDPTIIVQATVDAAPPELRLRGPAGAGGATAAENPAVIILDRCDVPHDNEQTDRHTERLAASHRTNNGPNE